MAMLFPDAPADVPEGFAYHADVMTEVEERALLDGLKALAFGEVRMRGQVARRRTIHFGWTYGYETWRVEPGPPIPAFLLGARSRAARLAGVDADTMAEVLVTHYPPGAGIGWHRDAPAFGVGVGVSVLGACRFRFPQGGGRRGRARPQAEPEAPPPVIEASSVSQVEDGIEQPLEGLPLSIPEPALAARVPAPEPARPLPSGRRAIFFDVENTSRAEHISRVIAHLALDRVGRRTEFFAVGNWRVIGHDTARLLARQGAALVHSAPSVGVRDWSDLRIAVASGVWLAGARPGDVIEIVSDDRAFDAVGDVAASLGVTFRRLSYRGLLGVPTPEPIEVERVERDYAHADRGGRRRRHRGGRGRRDHGAPRPVHHAPAPHAARSEPAAGAEPHTAPHDEIVAVVRDLARARGTVTLDSLANALKSRGFSRPPGSPRLITRLRRIKELDVNRAGVITLVDDAAAPAASSDREEPVERATEPDARDAERSEERRVARATWRRATRRATSRRPGSAASRWRSRIEGCPGFAGVPAARSRTAALTSPSGTSYAARPAPCRRLVDPRRGQEPVPHSPHGGLDL